MNDEFISEYIGTWDVRDAIYNTAFWLLVKYYYESERYDRMVCTGISPYTGDAMPMDIYEQKLITRNANCLWRQTREIALERGVKNEIWSQAKDEVTRFTYEYLHELVRSENNPYKSI